MTKYQPFTIAVRKTCRTCHKPLPPNNRHHRKCHKCWKKYRYVLQAQGVVPYGIDMGPQVMNRRRT